MRKNILLNTLYNIGIFVGLVIGYQYGIGQHNYLILAGAIVLVVIFIVLKVKLVKEVRKTLKN